MVGSKGVERRNFVKVIPFNAVEIGNPEPDKDFNVNGVNLRTVTRAIHLRHQRGVQPSQ